jgi:hypothetical protein
MLMGFVDYEAFSINSFVNAIQDLDHKKYIINSDDFEKAKC